MDFKQKVQSLTPKEVVGFLIEGLKNPISAVRMGTYGSTRNGICVGCAATNAIQKMCNVVYNIDNIHFRIDRAKALGLSPTPVNSEYLAAVEAAYNVLRLGNIRVYNEFAAVVNMTQLPETEIDLPVLETDNYRKNLTQYEEYYKTL